MKRYLCFCPDQNTTVYAVVAIVVASVVIERGASAVVGIEVGTAVQRCCS